MTLRQALSSSARAAATGLLLVAIVLAALLGALHTPWVQERVGRWAAARASLYGVTLTTTAFSYNLFTLHVHVEGLEVASTTDPTHPFFKADRLDVSLPRSILRGSPAISTLAGDGLRIELLRHV